MTVIWGMTPEARRVSSERFRRNLQESMPSWIRAPPESLMPTTGRADFDGVIHHLGYFLRRDLGERSAEHREVLGVGEDGAAFDFAPSSYHRVAFEALFVESEVSGTMGVKGVDLGKTTVVEQL